MGLVVALVVDMGEDNLKRKVMEIIGGYRYYTRQEHIEWCKEHHIPPVDEVNERYRNRRTLSGRPLLNEDYDPTF